MKKESTIMASKSKTAKKLRLELGRFSRRIFFTLDKPKKEFLHRMRYGIQESSGYKAF